MNYIIYEDSHFTHFFYKAGEGLCFKIKQNGHWGDYEILYPECADGFGVYCDTNDCVHILCSNINKDIVYILKRNSVWNKYVLSAGTDEVCPVKFEIACWNDFVNFFYSASYKEDMLLVHCILGANAKPVTVDKLSVEHPYFCINNDRIYYTNSHETLGYRTFTDGSCDIFKSISDDSKMPYAMNIGDSEEVIYKKKGSVYLNDKELFSDPTATFPIIMENGNKLTVQWESNNFIRYITSFNNGSTWSAPMRFISNGHKVLKFSLQTENQIHTYYGHDAKSDPVLYGRTDAFIAAPLQKSVKKEEIVKEDEIVSEYDKLRMTVDMLNSDIVKLKARIKKIEEIYGSTVN